MKIIKILSVLALYLISSASYAELKIRSTEAPFHVGENVVACGVVKQVTRFKRGFYLNMDKKFPHQSLTLVIWEDDVAMLQETHDSFSKLENKEVCGKGKITEYRGQSQISLYNAFSLKVK
ncbi:hypothetical protein [Vibrio splendidus]|uniref:hypothetical protein n=1 Tax=Vibrio splendidus TaxID=29497 RepID=UPI000C84FA8C|nr:hypothetical protein [Vibrio splendidus]PMI54243.1 hypothetical protein BCU42_18540 [Vibrio splendidus]